MNGRNQSTLLLRNRGLFPLAFPQLGVFLILHWVPRLLQAKPFHFGFMKECAHGQNEMV